MERHMSYNRPDNSSTPISTITPGSTSTTFTAPTYGTLFVSGGLLSSWTYKRGANTIAMGSSILGANVAIPMAPGDVVALAYVALTPPTLINFVPN
jgi:hypothetical protein